MTNFQCHYESLKVTRDAPPEVIRAAYRSLSQKHHPDKNGGNPDAARVMSRLNLAYSVLSDAVQRELYDLQLRARAQRHAFHEATADGGAGAVPPDDYASYAEEAPPKQPDAGIGKLSGWFIRHVGARKGRAAAIVFGVLGLALAVLCWSIWNEQRTMHLLEHAASTARDAVPARDAESVPAAEPTVVTKAPDTPAAEPVSATAAPGAASVPASTAQGGGVPPAVAKSSEYERLTALLKSMGLGLYKLDLPAQAARRAAPPPEPGKAAREPAATASARVPAGTPAPASEPAHARDEAPVVAEPARAETKVAAEANRASAAPVANGNVNASANANVESAAPRQPVVIDGRACAPAYPPRAYANGETGAVRMALLVGGDGNVIEAKVKKSSGSSELDRAARKALSQCKFKVSASQAEPAWTTLEYVFSID